MKEESFQKKLAQYITMSAAFLAAHAEKADAQIMYTDVIPDLVIHNSYFNLDLNNDGVVDFKLQHNDIDDGFSVSAECLNGNSLLFSSNNCGGVSPVSSLDIINVQDSFINESDALLAFSFSTSSSASGFGCFYGTDQILGVRLINGANNYYGWARFDVNYNNIVLKDYAINLSPDSAILAGENINGCTSVDSFSLSPITTQFICIDDSFVLNINNAIGESIHWQKNGSWIPDATDSSFIVTESGIYTVLVSDSNCAIITGSANFLNEIFNIYLTDFAYETCENSNGFINLSLHSNSFNFSYHWNTGDTTLDLKTISEGIYRLVVTSSLCQVSDTFQIELFNDGFIPKPLIYQNGNKLSTNLYDSYKWYLNDAEVKNNNEQEFNATKSGSYRVEVVNTEGCSGNSDKYFLNYNTEINISIFNKNLVIECSDNTLLLEQVEIVNDLGQQMSIKKIANRYQEFDLSNLLPGIYFYYIRTEQKTYSGKFYFE